MQWMYEAVFFFLSRRSPLPPLPVRSAWFLWLPVDLSFAFREHSRTCGRFILALHIFF